ncbi:dihydroorotate dehydrogenase PyrD [Hyperthermus butylicus]|uniref:Dihydroorotate dehydrogenase n=1 Tax=Hyperthermus butylicus (strain DSM 5456 / JCM 9403 / PLM1-5) TaxID=415426 RepID=A2BJH2_HYPBU|nr:dihydroorotate dehydrogenase PyrD [Hyperthermus butylicus]ABM80133.1 Dihydroorotate dehydrogenase [Hyperthermus butylicus DSM 5456]
MAGLAVRVAGLTLRHPVMNASGILGSHPEGVKLLVDAGVSAVVTKSFTVEPREGYPTPIAVPLPYGLLNAVGLSNPGIDGISVVVEEARRAGLPVVVSIAGSSEDEFSRLASAAEEAGADAIEVNLSCPHAKGMGREIGIEPRLVYSVVSATASVTRIPVIAKLGYVDRLVEAVGKALEAGARAVTLINTLPAMMIDVYAMKPVLGNLVGGLSGPAIHPVAVRAIYEVYREYRIDIIGAGGVEDWRTAAELVLAGARAVQVGTALVTRGLRVIGEIVQGLERYMEEVGVESIEELVGAAHRD